MLRAENSGDSSADPQLLRLAVDNLAAMVAYCDADLRCVYANKSSRQWFGSAPQSLVGKHLRELLGPELFETDRPYIEGVMRGVPQELEREFLNAEGGEPRHGLVSFIPDLVDGKVRGFAVLVTDISGLKRTELKLRESEERFRLTLDEAPIGMAIVGLDGRFIRVNRALCELVGYPPEELSGLTFLDITVPEDLQKDLDLLEKLRRGEIPRYRLEKRYRRKDGSIVDIMLNASALRGPDGAPLHYIAQIEDITEQKREAVGQSFLAEVGQQLAASLDYEETMSHVAELAVKSLADFCIIDIVDGDEVRRLQVATRDPSKEWVCETLRDLVIRTDRPFVTQSAMRTGTTMFLQKPSAEELAGLAQNPEHFRALVGAKIGSLISVPLKARGRLLGAMAFIASLPKTYGGAEVRFAEQLAERAALSIDNARLYREAKQATQMRDDVLGVVAHDLRSPLNVVLMMGTLLRTMTGDPAKQATAADSIQRAARRMNRLIQDLLDIAKMEAGHLSVDQQPVPVGPLLHDVVGDVGSLAHAAEHALQLEVAADLPDLWADRDRLLQVFENLIGNAIKFTPKGGRIRLSVTLQGCEVLFRLTDTGPGIPEEHLPHLFDRFWQAKKCERKGAGLGLAIVRGIVEAHGGRIWVESEVGVGTSFLFTIPTTESPEARVASHAKHQAEAQANVH